MTVTFSSPQKYERNVSLSRYFFQMSMSSPPSPLPHPTVKFIVEDPGYYKQMKTFLFLEIVHLKFCTLLSEVTIKFLYFLTHMISCSV